MQLKSQTGRWHVNRKRAFRLAQSGTLAASVPTMKDLWTKTRSFCTIEQDSHKPLKGRGFMAFALFTYLGCLLY
jgi:N-acetylglucosamine-6-phosphate deacetylase